MLGKVEIDVCTAGARLQDCAAGGPVSDDSASCCHVLFQ